MWKINDFDRFNVHEIIIRCCFHAFMITQTIAHLHIQHDNVIRVVSIKVVYEHPVVKHVTSNISDSVGHMST